MHPSPILIRTRLIFRYVSLAFFYSVQLAILILPLNIIFKSNMMGYALRTEYYPWEYLNILAFCAPLGIVMQRFFHPEEFYFYVNHSLGRRHLWPAACLLSWLLTGLAALALYVHDGRVKFDELWQTVQIYWNYNQSLLLSYLKQYPWISWTLMAILGLAAVIGLIIWLSSGDQIVDAESNHFELKIDSTLHQIKQRSVLKGAWINCKSGQIIGLLGRNGCGKSTLFKIIFGTLKADYSVLKINERYLKKAFLIPGLIAYMPQSPFLPRHLTVKQVIRLFTGQLNSEIFQDPRLKTLLKQQVSQLSGGECRYLELLLILSLPRQFILLDEPFSELEPIYKAGCVQRIKTVAQQGIGIIVSDHDYDQIIGLSQPLMLMHGGQTRLLSSPKDLLGFYLPT